MPVPEIWGSRRESDLEQNETPKQEVVQKYGTDLESALANYIEGSNDPEKLEEIKVAFIWRIAMLLKDPSLEKNAQGLEALIDALDAKLAPIAKAAQDAKDQTQIYK